MKWKTPCLPGFLPVVKEVQAGGVIGGRIDSSCPWVPSAISRAKLGIKPSATQDLARSQVAASKPTIMTFGAFTIVLGWSHVAPPKKKAVPLPCGRLPFSGLTRHDKQSPPPGRFHSS